MPRVGREFEGMAPTIQQRRMLLWVAENHPDVWLRISGRQLSQVKALVKRGYMEMKHDRGLWHAKITESGLGYAEQGAGL